MSMPSSLVSKAYFVLFSQSTAIFASSRVKYLGERPLLDETEAAEDFLLSVQAELDHLDLSTLAEQLVDGLFAGVLRDVAWSLAPTHVQRGRGLQLGLVLLRRELALLVVVLVLWYERLVQRRRVQH